MKYHNLDCEDLNSKKQNGLKKSGIQDFYTGKTILITGGTGFVGKVLVEKLLRSCPHLSRIYLLVRATNVQQLSERMENYFKEPIFRLIEMHFPNYRHKVTALRGDVTIENLGLKTPSFERVISEVDVIFHMAATVSFKEQLKMVTEVNVIGTENVLKFARNVENLKGVVHVSTAYSNYPLSHVEEKVYPSPVSPKHLIELVRSDNDHELQKLTDRLLHEWPNVYTITKSVAENLIREKYTDLPVAIFRPAIISAVWAQGPVCGWTDNYNGPVGMGVSVATGVTRVGRVDTHANSNLVPVDLVADSLLVLAAHLHRHHNKLTVYNFGGSDENPLSWARYRDTLTDPRVFPVGCAVWYPEFMAVRGEWAFKLLLYVCHMVPAYAIDFLLRLANKKPRYVRQYVKVNRMLRMLSHFSSRSWSFDNNNLMRLWATLSKHDRATFNFHIASVDWSKYLVAMKRGIKMYLLDEISEPCDALRSAYAHHVRLFWCHHFLKSLFFLSLFSLLYVIIHAINVYFSSYACLFVSLYI